MEVVLKEIPEKSILVMLSVVLAGAVVVIFLSLPDKDTPQSKLLLEIAKILTAGLVVGILSAWAKQLFERVATRREKEKAISAKSQGLFRLLQRASHEAIRSVTDEKLSDVASFDLLFRYGGVDFEDLLEEWEALEPDGPVREVRASYNQLRTHFNEPRLSPAFRKELEELAVAWSGEFAVRALGGKRSSPGRLTSGSRATR